MNKNTEVISGMYMPEATTFSISNSSNDIKRKRRKKYKKKNIKKATGLLSIPNTVDSFDEKYQDEDGEILLSDGTTYDDFYNINNSSINFFGGKDDVDSKDSNPPNILNAKSGESMRNKNNDISIELQKLHSYFINSGDLKKANQILRIKKEAGVIADIAAGAGTGFGIGGGAILGGAGGALLGGGVPGGIIGGTGGAAAGGTAGNYIGRWLGEKIEQLAGISPCDEKKWNVDDKEYYMSSGKLHVNDGYFSDSVVYDIAQVARYDIDDLNKFNRIIALGQAEMARTNPNCVSYLASVTEIITLAIRDKGRTGGEETPPPPPPVPEGSCEISLGDAYKYIYIPSEDVFQVTAGPANVGIKMARGNPGYTKLMNEGRSVGNTDCRPRRETTPPLPEDDEPKPDEERPRPRQSSIVPRFITDITSLRSRQNNFIALGDRDPNRTQGLPEGIGEGMKFVYIISNDGRTWTPITNLQSQTNWGEIAALRRNIPRRYLSSTLVEDEKALGRRGLDFLRQGPR